MIYITSKGFFAKKHELQQQEAGPSRQGDPSSRSDHPKSIDDDFKNWWSTQSRKPHDQIQVTSSQSLAEIQQPLAAHHLTEAQRVEQRQDTLVQQHKGHDQAGPSRQADTTIPREIKLVSTLIEEYGSKMFPCKVRLKGDIRSEIYYNKLSQEEYERASNYVDKVLSGKNNKSDRDKKYNIKTSLRNVYSYTGSKRRR